MSKNDGRRIFEETVAKRQPLKCEPEPAHALTRSTGYVLSECCQELERQLTLGAYLGWQDRQWWLFRKDGEDIESGKTIEELLFKLYI